MSSRNKMIRRSCKVGIENVICYVQGQAKIHFLLGAMDYAAVTARREFDDKVPITFSELRFVFRNWTRFFAKVIFYDDKYNETLQKPWDSHPNEWRAYAVQRLTKIIAEAEAKKLQPLQPAIAKAKKVLAAAGGGTAALMAIVDAGNELRNKIGRPTPL